MVHRHSFILKFLSLSSFALGLLCNELHALEGHWHQPEAAREFHKNWEGWQIPNFMGTLQKNRKSIVSVSGCTGTFVSKYGHILTNYGCILNEVAKLSSQQKNYLEDGVQSKDLQSAPIIEVNVEQILSVRDVSREIIAGIDKLPASKRADRIQKNRQRLESSCQTQGHLTCTVRSVADGLEYQLTLSRTFSRAAVRYTPRLSKLFKDHNPGFLQGGAPDKPAFAILQLFDTKGPDAKLEPLKVRSYAKMNRTKVKKGDAIYSLGYSNMYKRWIPKYWVEVNLNPRNSRLDDFYDYAKLKQRYLSEMTFTSKQNLIDLYPDLAGMNNWLWRLKSGRYGAERDREKQVYQLEIKKATELENYIRDKSKGDFEYLKSIFDQLVEFDKEGEAVLVFSHLNRIKVYQHWLNSFSAKDDIGSGKRAILSDAISLVSWLQVIDMRKLIKQDSPLYSYLLEAKKQNFRYFQDSIDGYYKNGKTAKISSLFTAAKALQEASSQKQFDESQNTWPIVQKWKRELLLTKSLPYYPSVNKGNILGMTLGAVKKTKYSPNLATSFASDLDLGFRNSRGAPTFNTQGQLVGMYFTTDHVKSLYLNHFYDGDIAASYHFSTEDMLARLSASAKLKMLVSELQ